MMAVTVVFSVEAIMLEARALRSFRARSRTPGMVEIARALHYDVPHNHIGVLTSNNQAILIIYV